jgi:hypothetical protein
MIEIRFHGMWYKYLKAELPRRYCQGWWAGLRLLGSGT